MISVVIPLYNKANCIVNTINSVLQQTYTNFELLIIDDGSTDRSLQIIRQIKDDRIRIIGKENEGVSKTRNRGVSEAKYDLIFFLDADDYIYPYCLESLMNLRDKYPKADLWSANYEKIKDDDSSPVLYYSKEGYIEDPHRLYFYRSWRFRAGSYLITKKSFIENGGFSSEVSVGEDYLFSQHYISSRFKCAYTPVIIMSYKLDNRSLSQKKLHYKKVVEWHFDFHKANSWQKLAFSELIAKRIVRDIILLNFEEFFALASKHKFWIIYGLYSILKKKFGRK